MEQTKAGFSYIDFLLRLQRLQRTVLRRTQGPTGGAGDTRCSVVPITATGKGSLQVGPHNWCKPDSDDEAWHAASAGMSKHPLPHSRQVSKPVVSNSKTTLLDHAVGISAQRNWRGPRLVPRPPPGVPPQPHFRWWKSTQLASDVGDDCHRTLTLSSLVTPQRPTLHRSFFHKVPKTVCITSPKRRGVCLMLRDSDFSTLDFVRFLGILPGGMGSLIHEALTKKKNQIWFCLWGSAMWLSELLPTHISGFKLFWLRLSSNFSIVGNILK